jgi:hypothetical protein
VRTLAEILNGRDCLVAGCAALAVWRAARDGSSIPVPILDSLCQLALEETEETQWHEIIQILEEAARIAQAVELDE